MSDSKNGVPLKSARTGHWVLVGGVLTALLLIGAYDDPVLAFLTVRWQKLLVATGLHHYAEHLQAGIDGGITKRLLPAVATYAALYLALCLLLLRLVLLPVQWWLAVRLYAGTLAVYGAIVLAGELAGNDAARCAYHLSRQVLDFVISPLPVAGLYVFFKRSLGPLLTTGSR